MREKGGNAGRSVEKGGNGCERKGMDAGGGENGDGGRGRWIGEKGEMEMRDMIDGCEKGGEGCEKGGDGCEKGGDGC